MIRPMGLRRGLVSLATFLSIPGLAVAPAHAQVAPTNEIVALVVEGTGYGHGRGMSQWGAYGWAVNFGRTWQWIIGHYYGGTSVSTTSPTARVRVRLTDHDGTRVVGIMSTSNRALWQGVGYSSVQAREVSPNRFDIYVSNTRRCPTTSMTGWTRVSASVAGPITFATTVNETSSLAGDVLGVCEPGQQSVRHYRGSIQLLRDSGGTNRVVNDVLLENYLKGVVSREVSTSWGDAGGGAGMHALRAQAIAARSYARSQNRYSYAQTCDSTACQAYGGATWRPTPFSAQPGSVTCEAGNATFECRNTNRAIAETRNLVLRWPDHEVVSTEFSASNGPRTAGGVFPSVEDAGDDTILNPNHRWTRVIDAHTLAAAYNLGTLTGAVSEADPNLPHIGVWDNRLRLTGTNGTVVVTNSTIRSAFGLPSPGFLVRSYARDTDPVRSLRFIGDSIGVSMSETSTSELPALLDRLFSPIGFDSAQNRCTAGCSLSGVGAAASVPIGTGVVVVELGYNNPGTNFGSQIDSVMSALTNRSVDRVIWVNLSERSGRSDFIAANRALTAAMSRWPNLTVIDWRSASAGNVGNRRRWFAKDGIHLTFTGQAEMARFIRNELASRF